MAELPQRKRIRIDGFDYSTPGAYFITVCTIDREKLFWDDCRGDLRSPANKVPLSDIGFVVHREIVRINTIYKAVKVEKFCVMPDHLHLLISINTDADGRPQVAPTISRIVQQFKGSVTKQLGRSIWQKSFYEHGIRNQQDYDEIWMYIENNPRKYIQKTAP